MAKQKLKLYQWDLDRAKTRQPLPLWREVDADLPKDHDAARKAAGEHARRISGGKVRAVSALAGKAGGFAVTLEMPTS